jgi:hypothetical protein
MRHEYRGNIRCNIRLSRWSDVDAFAHSLVSLAIEKLSMALKPHEVEGYTWMEG